jgi:hypothetical protein
MGWPEVFDDAGVRVAQRDLLLHYGATPRGLTAAVKSGALLRARRDHYVLPSESPRLVQAIRVGGRLACVSALEEAGLFAFDTRFAHIYLNHSMARLRSPRSRFVPLRDENRDGIELHWAPLFDESAATEFSVSVGAALLQVLRCRPAWHALASIDNALYNRMISPPMLQSVFDLAPERVQFLRSLVNGRAESGQETILRLIIVSAGLHCDLQVTVPTVGRVDLIVEGCLAVEADSRLAHDGWERHVNDRHRDLLLAKQRYMSLRPAYQHTMYEPTLVLDSILGLLDQSRNFRRSFS